MVQQQSKDKLLYQQVKRGNTERIKALRNEGAGLEYIDKERKTPLIAACMDPQLYNVAKTLVELGANVDAYRPGRHAGTPLHHAAKRGLEQTVKLLLSHGANVLLMNDDCKTPLHLARASGNYNVVRAIESHICLFSGWLRELYGPCFLGLLDMQLLSRKVWVVVQPCSSRNPVKPFNLELAIYANAQDAQPRAVVALWKVSAVEPEFSQPDPTVIILTKTPIKLAAANESDKQQLHGFFNACKGTPQVMRPATPFNTQVNDALPTAPPEDVLEDTELTMAIYASLQSALEKVDARPKDRKDTGTSSSCVICFDAPIEGACVPCGHMAGCMSCLNDIKAKKWGCPVCCAKIVDLLRLYAVTSSSCVICLDAHIEGACVPCGHMAGCMSCLNVIKAKKWGCPVCRAKIVDLLRLYAV